LGGVAGVGVTGFDGVAGGGVTGFATVGGGGGRAPVRNRDGMQIRDRRKTSVAGEVAIVH
jgi:hypothetical protein